MNKNEKLIDILTAFKNNINNASGSAIYANDIKFAFNIAKQEIEENYIAKNKLLIQEEIYNLILDWQEDIEKREKHSIYIFASNRQKLANDLAKAGDILRGITTKDIINIIKHAGIEVDEVGQFYRIESKNWISKTTFINALRNYVKEKSNEKNII